MVLTALALTLSEERSGRLFGYWLLCPAVRYAAFWSLRTNRIERCHLPVATWRDIESQVADTVGTGPVGATSAIGRALLPSSLVQWTVLEHRAAIAIDADAVQATPMVEVSRRLDAALLATAA